MTVATRPNLVIFMPDQLRYDAALQAHTPNLDELRARGTSFSNAFSQHPVCSPSRVSMLTGWYPHVAGHRTLTNLLKPWEPNLLALMQRAGYFVAWAGHRGDAMASGVTESSTDYCGFLTKPDVLVEEPYHGHEALIAAYHFGRRPGPIVDFDEATVRTAEQLLAEAMPEPWLLFVPLVFPHPPFTVEEPWYSMHDRATIPAPVGDGDGKAAFLGALRRAYRTDRLAASDWAELVATYYGMVSRVDDQLGRVMAHVDHERTATVFLTDHGEYLGDYGAVEKWPAGVDDCLLRNPLVITAPGGREGQTCDAMVEMVDLLPTLLELADTEPEHTQFGRSLTHLLDVATRPHRDAAFSEGGFAYRERGRMERNPFGHYAAKIQLQIDRPDLVGRCASMRTDRWTYVYRLDGDDELYDRTYDDRELRNLARSTPHAGTVRRMRDQLLRWFIDTSDVIPPDEDARFPRIPHGRRQDQSSGTVAS